MTGSTDGADVDLLAVGEIEVHGRIAGSSNATLLVTCRLDGRELRAVYKPERGERPLWDFPTGLWRRERSAYLLAEALGWGLVPRTIVRADAPYGVGSLQVVVDEDGESHYLTMREDPTHGDAFKRLAAFDVIANNADRKSGHVLLAEERIWAIDHGLTFHEDDKLRTVIWEFAGTPLGDEVCADLVRLRDGLPSELEDLLSPAELGALTTRIEVLIEDDEFPWPRDEYCLPWPLV